MIVLRKGGASAPGEDQRPLPLRPAPSPAHCFTSIVASVAHYYHQPTSRERLLSAFHSCRGSHTSQQSRGGGAWGRGTWRHL